MILEADKPVFSRSYLEGFKDLFDGLPMLRREDFEYQEYIETSSGSKRPGIRVIPRFLKSHNSQMTIDFVEDTNDMGFVFAVACSPGEMLHSDSHIAKDLKQLRKIILQWEVNLWEQLRSQKPTNEKKNNSNMAFLDSIREQLKDLPDEPFTSEEIENIRRELKDLKERVSTLEGNEETTEAEIERFTSDVEVLSMAIENLDKPQWYWMVLARLHIWLSKPSTPFQLLGGIGTIQMLTDNAGK